MGKGAEKPCPSYSTPAPCRIPSWSKKCVVVSWPSALTLPQRERLDSACPDDRAQLEHSLLGTREIAAKLGFHPQRSCANVSTAEGTVGIDGLGDHSGAGRKPRRLTEIERCSSYWIISLVATDLPPVVTKAHLSGNGSGEATAGEAGLHIPVGACWLNLQEEAWCGECFQAGGECFQAG